MANESKCGLAQSGLTLVGKTGDAILTGDAIVGWALSSQAVCGLATTTANFAAFLQLVAQASVLLVLSPAKGGLARMGASNAGEKLDIKSFSIHKDTGVKAILSENSMSGTVMSSGNPVQNAWVLAVDQKNFTVLNKAQTDSFGAFTLPVFGGVEYIVLAFKETPTDTDADVFARVSVPIV